MQPSLTVSERFSIRLPSRSWRSIPETSLVATDSKISTLVDVERKLADALGTSAYFLMKGDSQAVAATKVTDRELLNLFAVVEQLDDKDQTMVKTFIDALVTKRR